MSAKNFPYEPPTSLYDAFTRGVDRYRANYDKVFPPQKPKFEYVGKLFGLDVFTDRDLPPNALVYFVHSDFLRDKAKR